MATLNIQYLRELNEGAFPRRVLQINAYYREGSLTKFVVDFEHAISWWGRIKKGKPRKRSSGWPSIIVWFDVRTSLTEKGRERILLSVDLGFAYTYAPLPPHGYVEKNARGNRDYWRGKLLFPLPVKVGTLEDMLAKSLVGAALLHVVRRHVGEKPTKWVFEKPFFEYIPGSRWADGEITPELQELARDIEGFLRRRIPNYGTLKVYLSRLRYWDRYLIKFTLFPRWEKVPRIYESWVRQVVGQVMTYIQEPPCCDKAGVLEPAPPYKGHFGGPLPTGFATDTVTYDEPKELGWLAEAIFRELYPEGTRFSVHPHLARAGWLAGSFPAPRQSLTL